jgi:hypothetical protein
MATIRKRKTAEAATLPPGPPSLNGRLLARFAGHCFSFVATYLLIVALNGEGWVTLIVAIAIEFVMYRGKALLWERSRSDLWGLVCLGLDTTTNAGGLWPAMLRLKETTTWTMWATAFNLSPEVRALPALVISLVVGFLLAVLPFTLGDE